MVNHLHVDNTGQRSLNRLLCGLKLDLRTGISLVLLMGDYLNMDNAG